MSRPSPARKATSARASSSKASKARSSTICRCKSSISSDAIEDAEKATRLARAIFSDLTLYNGDRIARATDPKRDLAHEIDEARALFRSKVSPAHHAIFEDMLANWSPKHGPPDPVRASQDRRNAEVVASTRSTSTVMFLVVVMIAVAAGTFASISHSSHHDADKNEGQR